MTSEDEAFVASVTKYLVGFYSQHTAGEHWCLTKTEPKLQKIVKFFFFFCSIKGTTSIPCQILESNLFRPGIYIGPERSD